MKKSTIPSAPAGPVAPESPVSLSPRQFFLQRMWPHLAAILTFLLAAMIYCAPALKSNTRMAKGHDVVGWEGMSRQSFEYKEKHGHFPLWTQSMFSGMPAYQIAMDGNESVGRGIAAINQFFTLGLPEPAHYFFLAALFFYLMCLAAGISPWIAMVSALGYAFATYNPVIIEAGHNTKMMSMAYAPMIFAGLFLLQRKYYLIGLTTIAFFSITLIGQNHLQIVYYTLLIALLMYMFYLADSIRRKSVTQALWVGLLGLAGGLIGAGGTAINILPTYDYSKETMRGGVSQLTLGQDSGKKKTAGGLDKDYAMRWSMRKMETFTFFVPGLFGGSNGGNEHTVRSSQLVSNLTAGGVAEENALGAANSFSYWGGMSSLNETTSGPPYLGAIICFLFLCGCFWVSDWRRWWLISASLLGMLLAWGHYFNTFNSFMLDHFPLYSKFRAPSMAMVIPQFCFPLMAALGLQHFLQTTEETQGWKAKTKNTLIAAGAIILALLVYVFVLADYTGMGDDQILQQFGGSPQGDQAMEWLRADRKHLASTDLFRTILFVLLGVAAIWVALRQKRSLPLLGAALSLLVLVDLIGVDKRYLNQNNFEYAEEDTTPIVPTEIDQTILGDPEHDRVRVFNTTTNFTNESGTSYFHNSIGGYHPAKLGLYQDLIEHQISQGNPEVLNMLNTRYIIYTGPDNAPQWQRNTNAFGNAWLVDGCKVVPGPNEEMLALGSTRLRDTLVIQQGLRSALPANWSRDSSARIEVVQYDNDTLVYRSTSATPQVAVFSEIYYPRGWNAYVDGKKTDHTRVNYLLRGMALPAGTHEIRFVFEPESYQQGKMLSRYSTLLLYLLMLLTLLWTGYSFWKRKAV